MKILLDGQALTESAAATVSEAIEKASDHAEEKGRMITEVVVDGKLWDEQQIKAELEGPTGAEEVQLSSTDPRQLVSDTFEDACEALAEADRIQRDAAELFQADKNDEAMTRLNDAFVIWQSVQKAVLVGTQVAGWELTEADELSVAINSASENLNKHLTAIRDALQSDDPIGVSDTLLFELPIVITQWRSLLTDMNERVLAEVN